MHTYAYRGSCVRPPGPGHAGRPGPWAPARMLPGTLGARVSSSPRFQCFRVLPPKQGCRVVWSFWVTISREPVAVALASALSFARLLRSCSSQRNSPPGCLEERCSHLPGTPVPGQDSVRLCRGSCVCFLPASAAPRGGCCSEPSDTGKCGPARWSTARPGGGGLWPGRAWGPVAAAFLGSAVRGSSPVCFPPPCLWALLSAGWLIDHLSNSVFTP